MVPSFFDLWRQWIIGNVALLNKFYYYYLLQQHFLMAICPHQLTTYQYIGGQSETTQEPSKHCPINFNHLYMHKSSPLIPILQALSRGFHCWPNLPKATFTQSVLPSLLLCCICIQLTFTIFILLTIQYLAILFMCPFMLATLTFVQGQYTCIRPVHRY